MKSRPISLISNLASFLSIREFRQSIKAKTLQNESYMKQYEAQQEHIKKTESYIRKYKAGSRSTMAKSREKQLAKIERLTPPQDVPKPHLGFDLAPIVTTLALETTNLVIGYDQSLYYRQST